MNPGHPPHQDPFPSPATASSSGHRQPSPTAGSPPGTQPGPVLPQAPSPDHLYLPQARGSLRRHQTSGPQLHPYLSPPPLLLRSARAKKGARARAAPDLLLLRLCSRCALPPFLPPRQTCSNRATAFWLHTDPHKTPLPPSSALREDLPCSSAPMPRGPRQTQHPSHPKLSQSFFFSSLIRV
jgi:hypothetical protein